MAKIAPLIPAVLSLSASAAPALPGAGTQADPWRIESLLDFDEFAADANYWAGHTRLETDVNLAGKTYSTALIAPDTDHSDGFQGTAFSGVFDGNGHKLIHLKINDSGAETDYLGLFGCKEGHLANLRLEGGSVSGTGRCVSGLAAENNGGIISNCYCACDVSGAGCVGGGVAYNSGTISDFRFYGAVSAMASTVGGLAGYNSGKISDCYSTCDVSGVFCVGGGVGDNSGTISNCRFSATVGARTLFVGGLVGYNSGTISDCHSACGVTGEQFVGGIAGYNYQHNGIISNCHCVGHATASQDCVGGLVGVNDGATVAGCNSACNVTADSGAGGLVGHNSGTVSDCYSTGNVRADTGVGGLVGGNVRGHVASCCSTGMSSGRLSVGGLAGINNSGHIWNSYSTSETNGQDYVGGLVGWNYGSVSLCYSAADVNATGGCTGGLVGSNTWSSSVIHEGLVWSCFWDVQVQSHGVTDTVGDGAGIIVDVRASDIAQMHAKETFTSRGWDFLGESANGTSEIWQMPAGAGYPVLSFFHSATPSPLSGSGTESDPYLIADANELGMASWYPVNSSFKLAADIDLSDMTWSGPVIPIFAGRFEGDGHKLLNMRISGIHNLGLFRFLLEGARVTGLGLEGACVTGPGHRVAGLAARNGGGAIADCYVSGQVAGNYYVGGLVAYNDHQALVSGCYSSGNMSGDHFVGGLVAYNQNATVSTSHSTADVNGYDEVGGLVGFNASGGSIFDCHSAGLTSGSSRIGGLVGHSQRGRLLKCGSTGDVRGGSAGGLLGYNEFGIVSNCWSCADITGSWNVGGLVSMNRSGVVWNCRSGGTTTGRYVVGGLVGYNFNRGDVFVCCSSGPVEGVKYVGGLIGHNDDNSSVSNSYSRGSVRAEGHVGGLVGQNSATVSNCYSTGVVQPSLPGFPGTDVEAVGALVGRNEGQGSVQNSFWDICFQAHGVTESIGYSEQGAVDVNVAALSKPDMLRRSTFTAAGWDFAGETENGTEDVWTICEGTNYPRFVWEIPPADLVCPDGVSWPDFSVLAEFWGDDNCRASDRCAGADIDSSGGVDFSDLAAFAQYWLGGN